MLKGASCPVVPAAALAALVSLAGTTGYPEDHPSGDSHMLTGHSENHPSGDSHIQSGHSEDHPSGDSHMLTGHSEAVCHNSTARIMSALRAGN